MVNLPADFVAETRRIMGDERYNRFVGAFDEEAPTSIRVNPRIAIDHGPLTMDHSDGQVPWCSEGYYLNDRPQFTFDPLLHAGCYYVQEASSMFVTHILRNVQCSMVRSSSAGLQGKNGQLAFAAMVPMQVYNSLQVPEEKERLMAIRHLIIGGGAIDEAMEAELRTFPHAVWSTYGMTETLSHIALRRISGPEASEWYMPFPTVKLSTTDEGCLVIDAPEVCAQTLTTNDIVELKSDGRFRIRGRKDNVICSGGIKIQIEEVEQILKKYMRVPYIISKRKDEKFGEIVVLLTEGDTAEAQTICEQVLPKYHQPKVYLHVNQIPLTETGKPARKRAEELAKK